MLLNQLFEAITRTGKGDTAVVGWGRGMGHKGHMMLASSVITKAKEVGGDPYFVVSRTVGKDDPITPEEKLAIYKKVFPQQGHIFQAASDEIPDLTKVLSNLNNQGYKNAVVVVGADQVKAFQYLKNYNGKPDKAGNIAFNFDTLNVISRQETSDPSRDQEGPRATPMRQVLQDPSKSEEEQFQVWRDAMSPEVSDDEVRDLMNKARQRMTQFSAPKKKVKENEKQYRGWEEYEEDKSAQVAEFLQDMQPELFSRYGDEFLMNVIQKVCRKNPEASITQSASAVIRQLKSSMDEARMSAAVKLQRAFDRERAKSDASRKRGEEVMAQAKADAEKKRKEQGATEGSLNEFSMGDDGEDPTDNYPCYDCGSTIFLHHTKLCDLAEPNAIRDLPSKPGSQHWTGEIPKGLHPIPGLEEGLETVNEFAPDDRSSGEEDTLLKFARMWYNGNDAVQQKVEMVLNRMGWEIGEIESEEGGAFVVQSGDEHGNSYIGFAPDDLSEGVAEARANTASARAGLEKRKTKAPLSPEEQIAKDKARSDKWLEKQRAKQKAKNESVTEVSLGDYRKKAAMQKAQSQMGAMFGKPEEREKNLATFNKREKGLNRLKARDEKARAADQEKQLADLIARLPELENEYEQMRAKYKSLGGSNWQYADREQNLTASEREARSMEGPMNNLWRQIQAAKKAQQEQSVGEAKQRLDPKCWKGYRKAGTKMKGGVRVNNCVKVGEGWEQQIDAAVRKLFENKK